MLAQRKAVLLGTMAALLAALRGWWTDPAWLDSSFLNFRYARRISEHGTALLLGQKEPLESFLNPLWVAILSLLGRGGVHEMWMQPYVGAGLLGLLCGISVYWSVRHFSKWYSSLAVFMAFALPPLASSAHSGGDHLFLAVLSLCAAISVSSDRIQNASSGRSVFWVGLLALAGVGPLIMAIGLAVFQWRYDRRLVWAVSLSLVGMTLIRLMVFGQVVPHGPWVLASQANPESFLVSLKLLPCASIVGLLGLIFSWRRGVMWSAPFVFGVSVWMVWALIGGNGSENFGSVLVPAWGFLAVGLGLVVETLFRRPWSFVVVLSLLCFDFRQTHGAQKSAVESRMSSFKQDKVMAKFLRWRFEGDALVVVQTPGVLPYFLGKRTFDLVGLTHSASTGQAFVQTLGAEAMVPDGVIVGMNPTRLSVTKGWDWKVLANTHYQHAIKQSSQWKLTDYKGIWFNIYLRKDLEKYPPRWVEAYKKNKKQQTSP